MAAAAAATSPTKQVSETDMAEGRKKLKEFCPDMEGPHLVKTVQFLCMHLARAHALVQYLQQKALTNKAYRKLAKSMGIEKEGTVKAQYFRTFLDSLRFSIKTYVEAAQGKACLDTQANIGKYISYMFGKYEQEVKSRFPFTDCKDPRECTDEDLKHFKRAAKVFIETANVFLETIPAHCNKNRLYGVKTKWKRALDVYRVLMHSKGDCNK